MVNEITEPTQQIERKSDTGNRYGLSKKTNVAMAAVASLGLMANHPYEQTWLPVIAVLVIALVCVVFQGFIDWKKIK